MIKNIEHRTTAELLDMLVQQAKRSESLVHGVDSSNFEVRRDELGRCQLTIAEIKQELLSR